MHWLTYIVMLFSFWQFDSKLLDLFSRPDATFHS